MSDYAPIGDYLLTRSAQSHFDRAWRRSWDDVSPFGHARLFDDELVTVTVKLPESMARLVEDMAGSGKAKNRSDYIRRAVAAALYVDEQEEAARRKVAGPEETGSPIPDGQDPKSSGA